MAEYILDVMSQTSKLDWAFPFQRTGAFPIDRSAVFSSSADAQKYALGDGSDERELGGTSYVGQIISVYEAGEGEDGCPLDDPDADKDGVCDAWVAQKNYQDHFSDICGGSDNCPAQPGPETNMGCPEDNPDADGDGMCDPWVSQKNRLKDFAKVCKGYDNCPGEAGPDANKGCPWPDPDTDGDGLCDEWVTAKKMGYFFENAATLNDPYVTKACKGLDKCPYEYGPLFTDGCPAEDPDPDKDGVCDAWVTQQKVLDQFAEVCSGLDKCPLDSGSVENHGCKLDDPDGDKDGICDAWVTEKKMQDKYLEVCSGFDKCPYDAGDKDNNGCPLDDPDTDKDGDISIMDATQIQLFIAKIIDVLG